MGALSAFVTADRIKKERKWKKLYIALDIHGTVLVPNYSGIANVFYPSAIAALKEISNDKLYKIIMWTCSKEEDRIAYKKLLESHGIEIYAINKNPDMDNVLDWGDYSQKMYCNILLDDKAGFDPHTEWREIEKYMIYKRQEKIRKKMNLN